MVEMDEEKILKYWFLRNNLSKSTQIQYTVAINLYSKIVGKTIEELYKEAYFEEKERVMLMERGYSTYVLEFKEHLDHKYADNTVRNYINAVKSFYESYDIQQPKVKVPQGDICLEKNYGKLLNREELKKMARASNIRNNAIIYLMALSGMSQKELRD